MPHILITYGTRPLAQRLQRFVQQHLVSFASCEEIPSVFASKYHSIPHPANPVFAHELLKLSLDLNIDYILPLHPNELTTLKDTQVLFDEYGIQILVPEDISTTNTIQNPPSDYPLELFHHGKSLWTNTTDTPKQDGLYALVDNEWLLVTL